MTVGVVTIPLLANLCLDDAETNGRAAHRADDTTGDETKSRRRGSTTKPPAKDQHASPLFAGPENGLLVEAADSLLNEATSHYNPLILCGPPGSGKSHFAGGLVRHWRGQDRHAVYVSGGDFARTFATAIANRSTADWRSRQRDVSLFVLDDLTQLSGKQPALDELLRTIDALLANQSQIVVTSRLAPKHIPGMTEALAARLTAGLVVHVAVPGPDTRLELVRRFADARGVALEASAARSLAEGLAGAAPELFGAVNELALEAAIDSEPISADRVRKFLRGGDRSNGSRPTIRSIAALSAKYYGIKRSELTSPTRRRAVVQARNVAIYLARQVAGNSLEQLGRYFGGRDHTTILHGYRTIETRARTDPSVRQALVELRQMLAQG